MDRQLAGYCGLTILLWGFWGLFGKMALSRGMTPVGVFVAEIVISAACAGGILLFAVGGAGPALRWNVFGVLSGIGLGVGLLFYYLSLQRGQASLVVPLTASYPIVAALLAHLLLGEHLRPTQWIGVLLTVLGILMLTWEPGAKTATILQH